MKREDSGLNSKKSKSSFTGAKLFQKLRSDLTHKLSNVKLLLVNAEGFSLNGSDHKGNSTGNGNAIEELRDSEVECVAFSESSSEEISSVAESLGVMLHQGIAQKSAFYNKIKKEYSVSDNEIAFICRDDSDLPIIQRVSFSAVTGDADLDVKKESYYAAYGNGQRALTEIARLIVKAKNYPSGWSE